MDRIGALACTMPVHTSRNARYAWQMVTSSGVVLLCSFWCHSSIQVPLSSGIWLRCMMCRISSLKRTSGGRHTGETSDNEPEVSHKQCVDLSTTRGIRGLAWSNALGAAKTSRYPDCIPDALAVATTAYCGEHEAHPLLCLAVCASMRLGNCPRQAFLFAKQGMRVVLMPLMPTGPT